MPDPIKEIIKTDRAPRAIGPYSAGVKSRQFHFYRWSAWDYSGDWKYHRRRN